MPKRGKKYLESKSKLDSQKRYDFVEAVESALKSSYAKFDETVDVAVRLGVDPRHAEPFLGVRIQQIRKSAAERPNQA